MHEIRDTCECFNKPVPLTSIVTAHEDVEVHNKCRRDPHVDYLFVKPVHSAQLREVLVAHFDESLSSSRGGMGGLLSGLISGAHMEGSKMANAKALSAFTANAQTRSQHRSHHNLLTSAESILGTGPDAKGNGA